MAAVSEIHTDANKAGLTGRLRSDGFKLQELDATPHSLWNRISPGFPVASGVASVYTQWRKTSRGARAARKTVRSPTVWSLQRDK